MSIDNFGTISTTTYLMNKYGISAKKKFGQNFLIEPTIINKILATLDENDVVIEIGAGLGALTQNMAKKVKRVIAYEIDTDLYEILKTELEDFTNLEIINQDFLKVDIEALLKQLSQKVVFVSNLPYYITSELLEILFKNSQYISKIVAMMQKEVADRFTKNDRGKDFSPLQIMGEYYSDISLLTKVNRNNYLPAPKVDSAVLTFTIKNQNENIDDKLLYEIVEAAFSQRRKMVLSNLKKNGYAISKEDFAGININEDCRVEQLSLTDYIKIYEVIAND